VIGGQNNLNLLQDPAAMQRAVGAGGGASRQTHRDSMNDRVQEEARTKKKKLVTQTLTSALLPLPLVGTISKISCRKWKELRS